MARELPDATQHHRILTAATPPEREDWVAAAYLIEKGYANGKMLVNGESPEPYNGIAQWSVRPEGRAYVDRIERERKFLPKLWKGIVAVLGVLALVAAVYSAVRA